MAEPEVKVDDASEFDENKANAKMDRNSRSIAALGVDVFRAMESLRVLVVGLQGVGVETAKNIILGGPKAVTVWDPNTVQVQDLGTNFYLKASDVGNATRADASLAELQSLNPYVEVKAHHGELNEEFLHTFGVVIVTSILPKKELIRINEICRSRKTVVKVTDKKAQDALGFTGGVQNPVTAPFPVTFILALTSGASSVFFSDFGDHHLIHDNNGEPKKLFVIESIKADGTVVLGEKVKHNLDDGALVKITEAEGLKKLCELDSVKIKRVYDEWDEVDAKTGKKRHRMVQKFNEFKIDLTGTKFKSFADFGKYVNGGIATEVKAVYEFPFLSLAKALDNPAQGFVNHPDQEKLFTGRGNQLQLAYQALFEYLDQHGELPALHSATDADKLVAIAKEIKAQRDALPDDQALKIDAVDEDVIRKIALYARTELPGYSAFLGGVAGQEVVKRFGKFTPVHQWLTVDHFELLQAEVPADAKPQGNRYDYQVSIFGQAIQDKIMNQKWFMVGCGALGCEYLKGMALMGLGAGPNGKVTITDGDSIELSNLSRQFLFRHHHIGKSKALCGAEVAKTMNPDLNLVTLQDMVMPSTENVFTDAFWDGLDGAWNALDNVHARKYVDAKCLFHAKPLLESGTEGTKTNSEVIVPHKTRSYNDAQDAESEGIPQCTLRNFPNLIEHCIEWAKPRFTDLFQLGPDDFNLMLQDPKGFKAQVDKLDNDAKRLSTLKGVKQLYENTQDRSFHQCLSLAFQEFADVYYLKIKDLIHYFPKDAVVKDEHGNVTGPFWTGSKRFPEPALWDPANPDAHHVDYLYNAANLYAVMFGLEPVRDHAEFKALLNAANLTLPEWVPGDKPDVEEKKDGAQEEVSDKDQITALYKFFESLDHSKVTPLVAQKFEKDDDANFHVDFVTSCANLRAINYKIQPATRLTVKVIAGKIIPALATTTALITGLVELEYYKLVLGLDISKIRNANVNLAVSTYNFFEPLAPISAQKDFDVAMQEDIIPVPEGFTTWDTVVIDEGNLTLKQFIEIFPKKHHGVKVSALIGAGKDFLYDEDSTSEEDLNTPLIDLYVKIYGPLITSERNYVVLDGSFQTADDESAKVPRIKYVFKH